MLQMHFLQQEIQYIAEVGPEGPNGEEMKSDFNFEKVIPFARITERDFRLDKLIDGL
jgi:hypothetical protein